jgi:HPt (histidine-containing phosphotransfer) domain-containing protein
MDGYLSKPIDIDSMIATVEAFGGDAEASPAPVEHASEAAIFDEAAALKYSGGDRGLLREVVQLFRKDAPAMKRRIARAVENADGDALWMAAHALKGSLGAIGSPAGRAAASTVEQIGRAGDLAKAPAAVAALDEILRSLDKAFAGAGLATAPRRGRAAARTRGTERSGS